MPCTVPATDKMNQLNFSAFVRTANKLSQGKMQHFYSVFIRAHVCYGNAFNKIMRSTAVWPFKWKNDQSVHLQHTQNCPNPSNCEQSEEKAKNQTKKSV